jgi:hypothetical protein
VGEAASAFDHVLLDVPPVAANQSVAAATTTAEQRGLVAPDTRRGADTLPRLAGRLRDVDAPAESALANRGGGVVERADAHVPEGPTGSSTPPRHSTARPSSSPNTPPIHPSSRRFTPTWTATRGETVAWAGI